MPGMPSLMSVSKSTQVLSKFYFRDTPEQRAWKQYSLSGLINAIRLGLQCGQGWGKIFPRGQLHQDISVGSGVVWVMGLFSLWYKVGYSTLLISLFKLFHVASNHNLVMLFCCSILVPCHQHQSQTLEISHWLKPHREPIDSFHRCGRL